MSELIARFMDPGLFWELFWYVMAGGCATVVSQVGYSVCFRKFALGNVAAKSLSWAAAAATAFVMLRYLAFPETATGFWASVWLFFSTRIGTAVLTVVLLWAIIDRWLRWDLTDRERVRREYGWWPEIFNLGVTILENVINFVVAKFWVF